MFQQAQQDRYHVEGNNIEADGFIRVNVPLISMINPTNLIQGKYNFPENRMLTNKQIVGIQLHYGNQDITLKAYQQIPGGGKMWFANPTTFTGLNAFITLFDEKGIEIMKDFPAEQLHNFPQNNKAKIIPVNCKLQFVKCYILIPELYTSTPGIVPTYTLTFFYKN